MNLIYSEIGLAATYTRAMEEMYEDNVQYMELRTAIANVRALKTMKNVAKRNIITKNPAYILIMAWHRRDDKPL